MSLCETWLDWRAPRWCVVRVAVAAVWWASRTQTSPLASLSPWPLTLWVISSVCTWHDTSISGKRRYIYVYLTFPSNQVRVVTCWLTQYVVNVQINWSCTWRVKSNIHSCGHVAVHMWKHLTSKPPSSSAIKHYLLILHENRTTRCAWMILFAIIFILKIG